MHLYFESIQGYNTHSRLKIHKFSIFSIMLNNIQLTHKQKLIHISIYKTATQNYSIVHFEPRLYYFNDNI